MEFFRTLSKISISSAVISGDIDEVNLISSFMVPTTATVVVVVTRLLVVTGKVIGLLVV